MKQIFAIITALLLFSCNSTTKTEPEVDTPAEKETSVDTSQYSYAHWKLARGQIGGISLGMTIVEAEKSLWGLTRTTDESKNYGFEGDGPAYLYSRGDTLVLALIPKVGKDTLQFMVVFTPELQTMNGLNCHSSVAEIWEKYPEMELFRDPKHGWEHFGDNQTGWVFTFKTGTNMIGNYPGTVTRSKPVRTDIKADWIVMW